MKVEPTDPKHPVMSSEAIDERLRMVEQLRRLGLSLKEAGERGPTNHAATEKQRTRTPQTPLKPADDELPPH